MKFLFTLLVIIIGIAIPLIFVFLHAKFFAKQRVELANDWTVWFKKWSTWFQLTATAFGMWLADTPQLLINLWAQLPAEWRSTLPPQITAMLPFAFVIMSLAVSNIKQQKLVRQQAEIKQDKIAADTVDEKTEIKRNFIGR